MKEAVDRFIETVVVGLFLAPFVWLALLIVFSLGAWLLMTLGFTTRVQDRTSAMNRRALAELAVRWTIFGFTALLFLFFGLYFVVAIGVRL